MGVGVLCDGCVGNGDNGRVDDVIIIDVALSGIYYVTMETAGVCECAGVCILHSI